MNCSQLTWITVSPYSVSHVAPTGLTLVCHVHLVLKSHNHFWRSKWVSVHRYIKGHRNLGTIIVSDLNDVFVNPINGLEILDRFKTLAPTSLLISTEDTCWIGRVCDRNDVRRFQGANISNMRFIHSQFMGLRSSVLHMLSWGLQMRTWDDMHMMYEYAIEHPNRVSLDHEYSIFGSLAYATPQKGAPYMCWNGPCVPDKLPRPCTRDKVQGVCVVDGRYKRCPLLWHGNGLLSRNFLNTNPSCTRLLGRLK